MCSGFAEAQNGGQGGGHGRFKIVKAGCVASRDGMSRCDLVWRSRANETKLRYDKGLPTDPRHPWSFAVVQSAIAVADREPVAPAVQAPVTEVCGDLLKLFGSVPDGRSGQGRDHPVAAMLALAAAAVVAGMRGYTAIGGWVKDVPPPVLAELYLRAGAGPARPPSKATIWRVITDADAEVLDATVGSWLMSSLLARPAGQGSAAGPGDLAELMPVRLDGKTVRGARDAAGNQRHLLAALAGPAAQPVVAAQAEVGVKTNEVPMAEAVLGQIDLEDKVVTADALHTVKATAEFIHQAGGEFALPVKENRKALFDALDTLPWHQVPIAHTATDRGHGRITTRTIQVLPAPDDLPFPHVSQAYLIERHVTWTASRCQTSPRSASPARPQPAPTLPAWPGSPAASGVSNRCTGCDTLYREDQSQVRTRSGPRAMAALRNLAIGALHLAGRHDTTEATRWACRYMDRPFIILGLTAWS
jgi:predicted transposase YbfD/YdcC